MAAAARTAGQNDDEPGERSMTRHGMVQPSAAGTQPPATDPRASIMSIDADRTASDRVPSRQCRAAARRDGPSASTAALPGGGHAIPDTSPKPKSP